MLYAFKFSIRKVSIEEDIENQFQLSVFTNNARSDTIWDFGDLVLNLEPSSTISLLQAQG